MLVLGLFTASYVVVNEIYAYTLNILISNDCSCSTSSLGLARSNAVRGGYPKDIPTLTSTLLVLRRTYVYVHYVFTS